MRQARVNDVEVEGQREANGDRVDGVKEMRRKKIGNKGSGRRDKRKGGEERYVGEKGDKGIREEERRRKEVEKERKGLKKRK